MKALLARRMGANYALVVAAVTFVALLTAAGLRSAPGVLLPPWQSEFGWSRTATTVGLTLSTVIQALCAIPIGMAVDRFGPRKLAIIGVALRRRAAATRSALTPSAKSITMNIAWSSISTQTICSRGMPAAAASARWRGRLRVGRLGIEPRTRGLKVRCSAD